MASGDYRSEKDLVVEAVRFLRDSDLRLKQLRAELYARLARIDCGEAVELEDDAVLGKFLDEAEVDRTLAAGANSIE